MNPRNAVKRIASWTAISTTIVLWAGAAQGGVLIGDEIRNGNFADANARANLNVTDLDEWVVSPQVYLSGASSDLSSGSFGVDDAANTRSIQMAFNGPSYIESSAFSLSSGNLLNLAFDYGYRSQAGTVLNVAIYSSLSGTMVQSLASITGSALDPWVLYEASSTFSGSDGSYTLRFETDTANGTGDFALDRIFLEAIQIPEAPTTWLILSGLVAFSAARRRAPRAMR